MLTYLFYFFLAYLLYNIIFKLVLPVYRTTKQVKRSFRDMQSRMQQPAQEQTPFKPVSQNRATAKKTSDEYIDFEEVKE